MGLRSFIDACSRLLKLSTKPDRSELWLTLKICFLGVLAVGGIGFVIKLVAGALGGINL
jgi:protein translocase SEC61 complex gamma subunit